MYKEGLMFIYEVPRKETILVVRDVRAIVSLFLQLPRVRFIVSNFQIICKVCCLTEVHYMR